MYDIKNSIIMFIGTIIAPFWFEKWNLEIKKDSEDSNLYLLYVNNEELAGFKGNYLIVYKAAICFIMSQFNWVCTFLGY